METTGPVLNAIRAAAEALWWNGAYWGALAGFVVGVVLQAVLGGRDSRVWPVLVSFLAGALLLLATGGFKQFVPRPPALPDPPRVAPKSDPDRRKPFRPFKEFPDDAPPE